MSEHLEESKEGEQHSEIIEGMTMQPDGYWVPNVDHKTDSRGGYSSHEGPPTPFLLAQVSFA